MSDRWRNWPLGGGRSLVTATGGTVPRTLADHFADVINGADYSTIQAALDVAGDHAAQTSAGPTIVQLASGSFTVSATLVIPNGVTLRGAGSGNPELGMDNPATELVWTGGASVVVQVGAHAVGDSYTGGGVENLGINGSSLAATCLRIKDIQQANFEDLSLKGATVANIEVTNSTNGGNQAPTIHLNFSDIFIQAYLDVATEGAHGLYINGANTSGSEGVSISEVHNLRINHKNGDAVRIGPIGDAWTWTQLQTFRWPAGTGYGINAYSTAAGQINSSHVFLWLADSAGINTGHTSSLQNSLIVYRSDVDGDSLDPPFNIQGPGAFGVTQVMSSSGKIHGPIRIGGYQDTLRQDSMQLIRWDAANGVVATAAGNWFGASDDSIDDGAQPGGAIFLKSGAVSGNRTYMLDVPLGSGIRPIDYPQVAFIYTPLSPVTHSTSRMGLVADVSDPPLEGAYIEGKASTNANFQAIVSLGGVSTQVDTGIGVAQALVQWRIEATVSAVNFWYRTSGNYGWGLAASITTHIPTAALSFMAWIKTAENVTHWLSFTDYRCGANVEIA
jgi:hypothetical protein